MASTLYINDVAASGDYQILATSKGMGPAGPQITALEIILRVVWPNDHGGPAWDGLASGGPVDLKINAYSDGNLTHAFNGITLDQALRLRNISERLMMLRCRYNASAQRNVLHSDMRGISNVKCHYPAVHAPNDQDRPDYYTAAGLKWPLGARLPAVNVVPGPPGAGVDGELLDKGARVVLGLDGNEDRLRLTTMRSNRSRFLRALLEADAQRQGQLGVTAYDILFTDPTTSPQAPLTIPLGVNTILTYLETTGWFSQFPLWHGWDGLIDSGFGSAEPAKVVDQVLAGSVSHATVGAYKVDVPSLPMASPWVTYQKAYQFGRKGAGDDTADYPLESLCIRLAGGLGTLVP